MMGLALSRPAVARSNSNLRFRHEPPPKKGGSFSFSKSFNFRKNFAAKERKERKEEVWCHFFFAIFVFSRGHLQFSVLSVNSHRVAI
jgi:hypothetical protein